MPRAVLAIIDDPTFWLRPLAYVIQHNATRVRLYADTEAALRDVPRSRPLTLLMPESTSRERTRRAAETLRREMGDHCPRLILLRTTEAPLSEADRACFDDAQTSPLSPRALWALLDRAPTSESGVFRRDVSDAPRRAAGDAPPKR
ncbi:MAG: hypothetical protein RLO52_03725 [Sandaracinaceae bacterium]